MTVTEVKQIAPIRQIKLIAIDIDGTLFTPQRTISPRTRAAIQAARQAGIVVTLATGRRYLNVGPIADELGIDIPLILCDGSLIIAHPAREVLFKNAMMAQLAQQAVDILVRHKVQPIVHHIHEGVEESWCGYEAFDTPSVRKYLTVWADHPRHRVRRMAHAELCAGQPDPLRVVAFATYDEVTQLSQHVAELGCSWNIVSAGNYGTSELVAMHPSCTKASGVRALAEHLGLAMEEVMALGDNNNDIEMLSEVGWGVAMGQAEVHVQAVARAVTASNAEDGVALAIERYALNA
jgi:Cof subfamily protein (haloacid dehalogenase superfamily)